MSKKLFFKQLKLLIKNIPFIAVVIIMVTVVIYGQCKMFSSADLYVTETNNIISAHAQDTDETYDDRNLEKNINSTYQLLRPEYYLNDTLSVTASIIPILFIIVGVALIGEEFKNRTTPLKAAYFG